MALLFNILNLMHHREPRCRPLYIDRAGQVSYLRPSLHLRCKHPVQITRTCTFRQGKSEDDDLMTNIQITSRTCRSEVVIFSQAFRVDSSCHMLLNHGHIKLRHDTLEVESGFWPGSFALQNSANKARSRVHQVWKLNNEG
jgi:hypothetical protein